MQGSAAALTALMIPNLAPQRQASWAIVVVIMMSAPPSHAAAPSVYTSPAHESPVSAEPDDLLLIAGYGFDKGDRVIYRARNAGAEASAPPASTPESTPSSGTADVVSFADVPYSLTVRLPKVMRERQEYQLWVVTASGEWSRPVRINDARPLWITPAFVYATAPQASLPRYLKVVGRNLEPPRDGMTQVRLTGPAQWVLRADPAGTDAPTLDRYVAYVRLPGKLSPGAYRVEVSRDRSHWVPVEGQMLEVRSDPPPHPNFPIGAGAFGGCRPDDGRDDSGCLLRAVSAAQAAGGGTVVFGPGIWNVSPAAAPNGIEIPVGVSLSGAGRLATTIVLSDTSDPSRPDGAFTLLGHNVVQGITFRDTRIYSSGQELNVMLKLGSGVGAVEDVVIMNNVFDRPNVAISDGGVPIERLFITGNEFGAFKSALELAGNRFLVDRPFEIEDAVITRNLFKPGSYLDVRGRQGTLASEIGASRRVDFSENHADGAAADRLYSPEDAHGWRAGFFWHMNNNHEMLLVSRNVATCTGDKAGDGEAIAYDNNANTFALERAATVLGAGADSITIQGPLVGRQNLRDVRPESYYQGHYMQVGAGRGLGQVRKIVSYHVDAASGEVTFTVAPAWDVVPGAALSRVSIGREFWQVYTVANTVDQRRPLCRKSNRSLPRGGAISVWGQTADSVVAGNRQYDTDGILYEQYYNAEEAGCKNCSSWTFYVDFLQIRDNLVEGEYAWGDDCSSSGIFGSMGAGPGPHSTPPTVGYGVSIAHNVIDHADGGGGGAISVLPTWFEGPAPRRWPLVSSTLIDHNTLEGLNGSAATPCKGGASHPRTAISFGDSALSRATVLYANTCTDAERRLQAGHAGVVKVCAPDAAKTCECE